MWALTLLEQARATSENDKDGQLLLPRMASFKPDEVFPVKDCIAVFDKSFTAVSVSKSNPEMLTCFSIQTPFVSLSLSTNNILCKLGTNLR